MALNKEMTKEYTHSCETLYMKVRLVTYLDKCFKNCDGGGKSSVRETLKCVTIVNSPFPLFFPVIKGCIWIEHELPSAGKYRRVFFSKLTITSPRITSVALNVILKFLPPFIFFNCQVVAEYQTWDDNLKYLN